MTDDHLESPDAPAIAAPGRVVLPSGLAGRVRKLRTRDINRLLKGGRREESVQAVGDILRSCWIETDDAGPYADAVHPEGGVDWDKVLIGDRYAAMIDLRRATHGDEYAFKVRCPEQDCRTNFEWELSLADLPRRALSKESRDTFANGNRFETRLPDGQRVVFRLQTGADEKKAAKQAKAYRDRRVTLGVLMRVVEVDGVEHGRLRNWVEDLALDDLDYLFDAMDEHDCGVETDIEVECTECQATFEVDLPLDRQFYLPRRARSRAAKSRA